MNNTNLNNISNGNSNLISNFKPFQKSTNFTNPKRKFINENSQTSVNNNSTGNNYSVTEFIKKEYFSPNESSSKFHHFNFRFQEKGKVNSF